MRELRDLRTSSGISGAVVEKNGRDKWYQIILAASAGFAPADLRALVGYPMPSALDLRLESGSNR